MDYKQGLAFLKELNKFGIHLGLQRIEKLLDLLNNPQGKIGQIIHIAGTNGKGSTSVMLEAMLRQSYKTGLFTSPHLHSVRERFRVNGEIIKKEGFASLLGEIRHYMEVMKSQGLEVPTEFEAETALALYWFAKEETQKTILEAGLGGGLDSTKAANGRLSVITNIGMDHMEYLGNTIEEIAASKAGIISQGGIVITGAQGAALKVIEAAAKEKEAKLLVLGRQIRLSGIKEDEKGQYFDVKTENHYYKGLFTPLLGRHQLENGALAVAAGELSGASPQDIKAGLAQAFWPGRMELLPGEPEILLDGAHNPEGMLALAQAVPKYIKGRQVIAVLGMLDDKAVPQSLAYLAPYLNRAIVSRPPVEARTKNWQKTGEILASQGVETYMEEDIPIACQKALEYAAPNDLVLVCGSLFLLAPARAWFLEQKGKKVIKDD